MNPSVCTKSLYRSAVAVVPRCQQVQTPPMRFRNRVTVPATKIFPNLRSKTGAMSEKEDLLQVDWRQSK